MTITTLFEQLPTVEWHNDTPFAIAKLKKGYAKLLAQKALEYEPYINTLELSEITLGQGLTNATGARYQRYNVFMLDGAYMPLYLAARHTFRALLEGINHAMFPCYIRSWYNITRESHDIGRHTHEAKFIGSFLAFAEGSTTGYGPLKDSNALDHVFKNEDGMLLFTTSNSANFHEVSTWYNPDHPRISYAFDIYEQALFKPNKHTIPFEGL
jgi:hypothetical protein